MADSPFRAAPPKHDYDLVNVNFALPAELREELRSIAANNGISFTECVLRLLIEGLQSVDAQQKARASAVAVQP